jgi:hypothetical protein
MIPQARAFSGGLTSWSGAFHMSGLSFALSTTAGLEEVRRQDPQNLRARYARHFTGCSARWFDLSSSHPLHPYPLIVVTTFFLVMQKRQQTSFGKFRAITIRSSGKWLRSALAGIERWRINRINRSCDRCTMSAACWILGLIAPPIFPRLPAQRPTRSMIQHHRHQESYALPHRH